MRTPSALVLTTCLAAAGCATTPPTPAVTSTLRDAGARLFVYERAQPRAELRLEILRAAQGSNDARCPGPFVVCAVQRETWNASFEVSLFGAPVIGTCELTNVASLSGTHVCGGALEGETVVFALEGDALQVRFAGNKVFPRHGVGNEETFTLVRADPIALGFAAASKSGNSSPETGHLALLTEPLEKQASARGFGTPAAARHAVVAAGLDPASVPLQRAEKIATALGELRIASLRLLEDKQQALTQEVVEDALGRNTAMDPSRATPPADAQGAVGGVRFVEATPGTGPRPTPDGSVLISYQAWNAAGEQVAAVEQGAFELKSLSPRWKEAVSAMPAGTTRIFWLPEASPRVVTLTVRRAGRLPAPPDSVVRPPEAAQTARNGLRYVLLEQVKEGPRPTPEQELQVRFTAWNANGRVLRTTAWDDSGRWRSLSFTGEDSLEVVAAQVLRRGERARFWVPLERLKDARDPRDEMTAFDLELLDME